MSENNIEKRFDDDMDTFSKALLKGTDMDRVGDLAHQIMVLLHRHSNGEGMVAMATALGWAMSDLKKEEGEVAAVFAGFMGVFRKALESDWSEDERGAAC
jgi:hypothetical protein